jgi:hypothetical protein
MQITQFIAGASAATVHSFVYYVVPIINSSQTEAQPTSASAAANSSSIPVTSRLVDGVERHIMPCLTSSGETFAVWLNILYLAPLTYLFVSFFIESYLRRSNAASATSGKKGTVAASARRLSNTVQLAEKAGWEAAGKVEREVYGEGNEEAVVDEVETVAAGTKVASGRALRSRK